MQATVAAVKRVGEIKSKREKAFWKDRYALIMLLSINAESGSRMNKDAAPSLARDALEVSRGHHLLGQKPTEQTLKALAAAEKRLAAKEARRQARIKANRSKAADAAMEEDEAMDAGEVSLADAVAQANVTEPETREKIKVKVKSKPSRRSALVPSGSGGMDMS